MRILALALLFAFTSGIPASAADYWLVYLGGQSNMDGFGYLSELPDSLNRTFENVWIFHGNPAPDGVEVDGRGVWSALRPGHGTGFSSDGATNTYSERFGVELSLAARLTSHFPEARFAFIKYSRGGTSIDCRAAAEFGCWDPDFAGPGGVNQYDHFLATLRNAWAAGDIDGDGSDDRLIPVGIVWMQGESDAAHGAEIAFQYEHHLRRLMDLLRAALRVDDLPMVVGRISDSEQDTDGRVWNDGSLVRAAQAEYVRKDSNATLITSTDTYAYSDRWHYDGAGYVDLGIRFADALARLLENNPISIR